MDTTQACDVRPGEGRGLEIRKYFIGWVYINAFMSAAVCNLGSILFNPPRSLFSYTTSPTANWLSLALYDLVPGSRSRAPEP